MLRVVRASRYVRSFRQGGSAPALVEADDLGMYVVKLRGAAQGAKALVAELLAGELARAVGLPVPEIVLVDLDRAIALPERDPELRSPLEASHGRNLGLDYLPGSAPFNPKLHPGPDAITASRAVLLDALVLNVDRTASNVNVLVWHGRHWLIDHGAALHFHHGWRAGDRLEGSRDPFRELERHVLLPWASRLDEAAAELEATLTDARLAELVAQIPSSWLAADESFDGESAPGDASTAYLGWLRARRDAIPALRDAARLAHARVLR